MPASEQPAAADYCALVTAAGASSRMGRPKALVPWRGVPLLLHQARVLAACDVAEVVAVVGKDAAAIAATAAHWDVPLRLVVNARWELGRSTSLEVGAAALAGHALRGVLIAAVDQPLDEAIVRRLLAASPAAGEAVVPVHSGRRGHPVVLSAALLAEVMRATQHPEGLRDIVRAADVRLVEVDNAWIHLDLNTIDDVAAAEQEHAKT